jgi:hypothetical protein
VGFSSFLSSRPAPVLTASSGFSSFLSGRAAPVVEVEDALEVEGAPKRVSFTTADGRVISFRPKKREPTREPGPYALYVKANIGPFLAKGFSAPEAMVKVAKKYRKEQRG